MSEAQNRFKRASAGGSDATQRRIEQLERELAQARLALEDFTYSVAHDLRASLRHVSAYLRIVQEELGDGLDASISAQLDKAFEGAAQMGRLMDSLLELSRVGRAQLQVSDVDLRRLVSDLRHQLEPEAQGRSVEWRVAPDLPTVRGDMALLGQMLERLLNNALKFTRDCPLTVIDIDWNRRDDATCELVVRDNGAGFDPRFQDRLFRVFQRLHSARQFDGIGVGLALARLVVERHGGTIRAQGEAGSGCQISLTLPLAPPAPA